ncbi:MAG: ABC transporter substrate-binding protein [Planctomycetota bacterium]
MGRHLGSIRRVLLGCGLLCILLFTGCPAPKTKTPAENSADSPNSNNSAAASKNQTPGEEPASSSLRVLVVDDPSLAEAIENQWQAVAEQTIRMKTITAEQLEATTKTLAADVILFPHDALGTLVERRQIVPVADEVWNGTRWNRRDLLELPRQRESTWGQTVYALPLGSRQLMLWYRRDLFDKLGLSVPRTWSDYQTLAEQLGNRELLRQKAENLAPAADQPWTGALEPLGGGFSGSLLTVRAAAYLRHRSQYSTFLDFSSLEPLLSTPPFTRALEELTMVAKLTPNELRSLSPDEVRQAFLAGRAAMAITWASATDEAAAAVVDGNAIGVAIVPGSTQMYNLRQGKWEERVAEESLTVPVVGLAGRLGATTRECRRSQAAWNFLLLLSCSEWSSAVLSQSSATGIVRREQLRDAQAWLGSSLAGDGRRDYLQAVEETSRQTNWLTILRIPGQSGFRAALSTAVDDSIADRTAAAAALEQAADAWRKIIADRDPQQLKAAYRRDLGLEK